MNLGKLLKVLFSRLIVVGVLIIIQALIFGVIIWKLSHNFVYIYGIFTLLSCLMVLYILNKDMNPSMKLPWVILLLVVPVFGGLAYLFLGTAKIPRARRERMKKINSKTVGCYPQNNEVYNELEIENPSMASQAKYAKNQIGMPVYKNTDVEYYKIGEDKFKEMLVELKKAKKFIFMEYFIVEEGVMWNSILNILKEKVKEGVDVRVMYDDGGCIQTLPRGYEKKLREFGIKVVVFNKLRPALDSTLHNRDHRKITVIDGHTGFTGGINLADEYINEVQKYGHWKDCGVKLKGEGVYSLTLMFLETWNLYTDEDNSFDEFSPFKNKSFDFRADGYVLPFGDTPLDDENISEGIYLNIINQSKNYLYINTPYLIPDNEILTALTLAAKRGVEVIIVTPYVSDNWFVQNVAQSHYKVLLTGGVKIYEYSKGFIHSKTFLSDDEVSVVGTINLDYRSLYHNYECGVWMYKSKAVMQLKEDVCEMLKGCKEVTLAEATGKSIPIKVVRGVLRFIAPLM
ncbi:MAG: cardiolipin synthase [Clostridium sp.]